MHSALISSGSKLHRVNSGYEFGGPFQEEWEHTGMDPESTDIIQKLVKNRLCDSWGRFLESQSSLCGQTESKGVVTYKKKGTKIVISSPDSVWDLDNVILSMFTQWQTDMAFSVFMIKATKYPWYNLPKFKFPPFTYIKRSFGKDYQIPLRVDLKISYIKKTWFFCQTEWN